MNTNIQFEYCDHSSPQWTAMKRRQENTPFWLETRAFDWRDDYYHFVVSISRFVNNKKSFRFIWNWWAIRLTPSTQWPWLIDSRLPKFRMKSITKRKGMIRISSWRCSVHFRCFVAFFLLGTSQFSCRVFSPLLRLHSSSLTSLATSAFLVLFLLSEMRERECARKNAPKFQNNKKRSNE